MLKDEIEKVIIKHLGAENCYGIEKVLTTVILSMVEKEKIKEIQRIVKVIQDCKWLTSNLRKDLIYLIQYGNPKPPPPR